MADRLETWKMIVQGLQTIEDAVDLIGGVELDETELEAQLSAIQRAAREIRGAAHDYLQPEKG
ncbi:hypothetical protein OIU34_23575 [Pararhizobium sp. BT-229]|uniref:hypothetical protein n=1 Tax=Pararhizobium sp. BT-229 TaxID=2986923 RepID=UPI0021F78225|nr:hypothetical protein [Pararhizobium sp. BT-229]MCV9964877.1 hypothetical protein [Pararhizobium sp. BT-229]